MKKIAIVTITDYLNIGNRLQNLAVQNILEERYNCKIESIQNFGRNQGCEYNCSKGYFTKKKLRLKILIMLGRLFSQFKNIINLQNSTSTLISQNGIFVKIPIIKN